MSHDTTLIPPPPVVRERLATHIREGRLLRSLLRLSVRAAEERHRQQGAAAPQTADRQALRQDSRPALFEAMPEDTSPTANPPAIERLLWSRLQLVEQPPSRAHAPTRAERGKVSEAREAKGAARIGGHATSSPGREVAVDEIALFAEPAAESMAPERLRGLLTSMEVAASLSGVPVLKIEEMARCGVSRRS